MAASSSDEARGRLHAARFRLLRKLGSSDGDEWAAVEMIPNGRTQLVVAEQVSRARHSEADIAEWMRNARRLATLEHANVARVRDVVPRGEDVLVISDFVDGVRWSEMTRAEPQASLELSLRVFSDVLSGLSAIHNLRDEKRQPLGLVHGALTPESVVVGLDGVARVVGAHHIRVPAGGPGSFASSYLAPEVLLGDDTADPRADVYGVGVMLWEALSGRTLFENTVASAIVTQVLSGKLPRAGIPAEAAWAAPLADLVARALRGEAARRLGSAAAFGAELRRIAGPKLAPTVRVAAFMRAAYGDSIRSRRTALERAEGPPEEAAPRLGAAPIEAEVDVDDRAPTIPPAAATPSPPRRPPGAPPLPPPRSPPTTMRGVAPLATAAAPAPPAPAPARPQVPLPLPPPPALERAPAPAAAPMPAPALVPAPATATEAAPLPTPAHAHPTSPAPVTASELESVDVEVVSATPTPPPPTRTLSSTPPAVREPLAMRNRAAGVLIFACAAAVGAVLVWTFASYMPKHPRPQTTVVAPEFAPAASLPPPAPAEVPEQPANPTPTASSEERPTAASTSAVVSEERATAPQVGSAPDDRPAARPTSPPAAPGESAGAIRPAPPPLARPASKRKYEPEGI